MDEPPNNAIREKAEWHVSLRPTSDGKRVAQAPQKRDLRVRRRSPFEAQDPRRKLK